MDTKDIEKFDPTTAELKALVKASCKITADDLEDPKQLAVVKENRIALKKARVQIEKTGKALREDANAFAKAVIAKEKELIAIIEPEEDRLAAIEEEAKQLAVRKDRLEKLPARKERLEAIAIDAENTHSSFEVWVTEEQLLGMDSEQFEAFYNQCVANHHAQQQVIIDARNAKIKEEQEAKAKELAEKEAQIEKDRLAIEHEKEVKAAEEKARIETEARLKKEREDEDARIAQAKKDEDERLAKEKKEADAKLARQKKYQDFLKSMGMTKDNVAEFHKIETDTEVIVYKKVGVFTK